MNAGGASTTVSVLLWVVLGAAELVGLSAGDLIERHGLRRVWTVALAPLGTASAVIGLLPGLPVAAFAGIAVFGAAYVTLTTVISFWITRMHPETTAAAVALGFLMVSAGQAVASPARRRARRPHGHRVRVSRVRGARRHRCESGPVTDTLLRRGPPCPAVVADAGGRGRMVSVHR